MRYLALLALLTGCTSSGEGVKMLIDQLEFYEGDRGCVEIRANIDLNPIPLVSTNASVIYKKDTGDGAPTC